MMLFRVRALAGSLLGFAVAILAIVATDAHASTFGCQRIGLGNIRCDHSDGGGSYLARVGVKAATEYVKEAMNCGPRQVALSSTPWTGNPACRNFEEWCPLAPGTPVDPTKQIRVEQFFDSRTKQFLRTDINCDFVAGPPMPSMAAIKAEATKYAPRPRTASGGTRYLVNAAVVFYATPPAGLADLGNVTIPRFTLSGHTFDVHLTMVKSSWSWGDGGSDSFAAGGGNSLGTPYDDGHPCESSTSCPDYIAHVFRSPGTFTVTASARWSGTYSVDGNAQRVPIPGELVSADPTGRTVAVHEAHSVLVAPN
jgi:hypothetical protein